MISTITTQSTTARRIATVITFFMIAMVLSLPALSQAAMYAYVNTDGNVRLVNANDPSTAIMTAPGRAVHSGVMLLQSAADAILGDKVGGV